MLFPFRSKGIRLIPQHRKYRRLSSDYQVTKPYGHQPDDRIIFNRMEAAQIAALETLAARNLIVRERLRIGQLEATSEPVPEEVAARIEAANQRDAELMTFLGVLASEYSLTGADGLKDRTNLLEYRYDAI